MRLLWLLPRQARDTSSSAASMIGQLHHDATRRSEFDSPTTLLSPDDSPDARRELTCMKITLNYSLLSPRAIRTETCGTLLHIRHCSRRPEWRIGKSWTFAASYLGLSDSKSFNFGLLVTPHACPCTSLFAATCLLFSPKSSKTTTL